MSNSIDATPYNVTHAGTGRTHRLLPSRASDWAGEWPTELVGDVFITESPGNLDGSLFVYWLGAATLETPGILESIEAHLADHDVVGTRVVFGFPDDAHSSLRDELARRKAAAQQAAASTTSTDTVPRDRITARVVLQTWGGRKRGDAVFQAERMVDATDIVLLLPHEELVALADGSESTDEIGYWLLGWDGPLEVYVTDAIMQFFGVASLQDITEAMLRDAVDRVQPKPMTSCAVALDVLVDLTLWPGVALPASPDCLEVQVAGTLDGIVVGKAVVRSLSCLPAAEDAGEGDVQRAPASAPKQDGQPDPEGAKLFFRELLASVETLEGIVDQYGLRTLTDLMYLHQAILEGDTMQIWPGETQVGTVLQRLPSADRWFIYTELGGPWQ